jgi:DNA-binding beta-propeller fold protein YncE
VLKGDKEFDEMVAGVHRDFPAMATAKLAYKTEEKDLIPEGLAYDARQDVFYLSSLNRRKIVKIAADGKTSDFVPAGRDHLLPVLGLRVAPSDGTVWAASWDEGGDRSELLHFDASGNLLGRYAPHDSAGHGFNDLVVLKNGAVLLTDTVSGQILRFAPQSRSFAAVAAYRALSGPNGIAVDDSERQLFVADDFGVVRIDLTDGSSSEVSAGARNTLAGVDGLYWYKGSLIAVQNAIGSPRIMAFRLSPDARQVTKATVLENRSAFTRAPTTGAIRGDNFYFIADSQIDNLNGTHILDVTKLQPVRIAAVHLP